jgi:hypothetical protein
VLAWRAPSICLVSQSTTRQARIEELLTVPNCVNTSGEEWNRRIRPIAKLCRRSACQYFSSLIGGRQTVTGERARVFVVQVAPQRSCAGWLSGESEPPQGCSAGVALPFTFSP